MSTSTKAGEGFRPEQYNPSLHVHGSVHPDHCYGNPAGATPPPRFHSPSRRTSTSVSVAALHRCPRAAPSTACTSLLTPRVC